MRNKENIEKQELFTQTKKNYEDDDACSASFKGDFFLFCTYTAGKKWKIISLES